MAGIEFLDVNGREDGEPEPAGPAGANQPSQESHQSRESGPELYRAAVLTCAGLWLAAAVVTLIAPFRLLYRVAVGTNFADEALGVDGWGRQQAVSDAGQHGARFGVIVYAGVALLLAAAALCLRRQARGRAPGSAGMAFAFAAVGVIGGTVAAAALEAQSVFDSVRASLRLESLDPSSRSLSRVAPQYEIGWCVWLCVIAVGCVVLALVLPPAALRVAARAAARRPLPAPASHHGEDLIGSDAPA